MVSWLTRVSDQRTMFKLYFSGRQLFVHSVADQTVSGQSDGLKLWPPRRFVGRPGPMADTNNRVVDRNLVEHSLTGHRCFAQALDGQDAAFLKLTENLEDMIKTALSSAHPHAKNIVRETGTALQKYSKVSTEPSHRVSSNRRHRRLRSKWCFCCLSRGGHLGRSRPPLTCQLCSSVDVYFRPSNRRDVTLSTGAPHQAQLPPVHALRQRPVPGMGRSFHRLENGWFCSIRRVIRSPLCRLSRGLSLS
jgi:hypothetical protein